MTRTRRALAALAALSLLAAACGDDDGDADTTAPTAPAGDDTTTTGAASDEGPADAAPIVDVASSDLGDILVSDGMTLYLFLPDDGGTPTCYDDCAQTWPPLLADGEVSAGEGVEGSTGTVARDDGGEQVMVNGWPLYFFANDTGPGDTNGQGLGDNWFVVSPDGEPIQG